MRPVLQVALKHDGTPDLKLRLKELTRRQVLVGVPQAHAMDNEKRKAKKPISNAMIAYVQDRGSPLQGIPPRPFMRPGIMDNKAEIVKRMEQAGKLAIKGANPEPALIAVGLTAQSSIRRKITQGPFTPLKAATLAARRRRGRTGTRILIDTGQLRQSINFVIREKK